MQEIAQENQPKENKLKITALSLIVVALIALIALTAGFQFGRSRQFTKFFPGAKVVTAPALPAGWKSLNEAEFSINYPRDWEAKENPAGEPTGATIRSVGGKVQVWLVVDMPYQFSEEQKKQQTGKKESKIKVGGRDATETEFTYESGGYFLIVEVPPGIKAPKVTFWATAANDDYKKTVLAIIDSFQTKNAE